MSPESVMSAVSLVAMVITAACAAFVVVLVLRRPRVESTSQEKLRTDEGEDLDEADEAHETPVVQAPTFTIIKEVDLDAESGPRGQLEHVGLTDRRSALAGPRVVTG